MRKRSTTLLLALGAALVFGGAAGTAHAQPANCGDVNGDGQVNAADFTALSAGNISASCAATNCADVNATGGIDIGDEVGLGRFVAASGASACSQGNQNLLYRLCTGPGPVATCNTAGTPFTGAITANTTWPGPANGCTEFFIAGRVTVQNNATLTVNPGARIRAIVNPADPAAIIVTRGSKLDANGATNPIIFTSAAAPGARAQQDWGGVVVNGCAPVNFPGGEGSSEGLPPGGIALFGGDNPLAFSARVRFARIEFSGIEFSPDNELNVFTMNGMGRLSAIDHVQANVGFDDGHEWFGGTARAKFMVSTGIRDDNVDWQIGWRGALQYFLGQANANLTTGGGRHGFEADNNEFGFNNLPRAWPSVCNVTVVGPVGTGTVTSTGSGGNFRRGTGGGVANTIFMNWPNQCLDLDNDETLARACTGPATLRNPPDNFRIESSICFGNGGNVTGSSTAPVCTPAQAFALFQGVGLTVPGASPLPGVGAYPTAVDNRYLPAATIPGIDCDNIVGDSTHDGFMDDAPFIGAFDATTNWLLDATPCPAGQPFFTDGTGDNCWVSFDVS